MAEGTNVVVLKDDFYRDGIGKVITIMLGLGIAFAFLLAMSLYLFFSKPQPISFPVGADWRVVEPVPVDQPYLGSAEVLQWVSSKFPKSFTYDFTRYNDQLQDHMQYFTSNGWQVFVNQLNNYINYNTVQLNKQFVSGAPTTVPLIENEGVVAGRYAWWVTMPVTISIANSDRASSQDVIFQVLVVRVPTTDNLVGVAIDNVIVKNPQAAQGAA